MNLDEPQRQQVSTWIEQGLKLSDIQTKLAAELGVKMTYMEVRLLMDDLKLRPKDIEPPKSAVVTPAPPAPDAGRPAGAAPAAPAPLPPPLGGAGKVSVIVDQVARPGALVSGKVTFSDGKSAEWSLDQFGRLSLAAKEPGYKPSQADVAAFQTELQQELARLGF